MRSPDRVAAPSLPQRTRSPTAESFQSNQEEDAPPGPFLRVDTPLPLLTSSPLVFYLLLLSLPVQLHTSFFPPPPPLPGPPPPAPHAHVSLLLLCILGVVFSPDYFSFLQRLCDSSSTARPLPPVPLPLPPPYSCPPPPRPPFLPSLLPLPFLFFTSSSSFSLSSCSSSSLFSC